MEFYRFEDMNLQSAIDQTSQSVTSQVPITREGELNSIVFAIWVRLGDADGRSNRTTDELVSDTPDLAHKVGNSKGGAHFNSAQGYAQCARNWLTPTLMLDPPVRALKGDIVTMHSKVDATGVRPSYRFSVSLRRPPDRSNITRENTLIAQWK